MCVCVRVCTVCRVRVRVLLLLLAAARSELCFSTCMGRSVCSAFFACCSAYNRRLSAREREASPRRVACPPRREGGASRAGRVRARAARALDSVTVQSPSINQSLRRREWSGSSGERAARAKRRTLADPQRLRAAIYALRVRERPA
jgi:hypothetical protein